MDFKGITWAGNIYEKFEAMCLEVEEVMYEDTVKYVENQVQKVGVSVKKFYAEVMEDLLPPSCVGPVKVAATADMPLELYTQTDINKKPQRIVSDIHGDLNNKETRDEDICDLTAEDTTLSVRNHAKHLSVMSPGVLVANTKSEECSKKSKRAGVSGRSIGIKRISHPPKVSLAMLVRDVRSNCLVASDDLNVTTSSEFFGGHDPGEAVTKNKPISGASVESRNSDQILSAESVEQEKNGSECTFPAPDKDLSAQNNDATECNSSCHGSPPAPTDKFRKDGSLSQMNSTITDTCEVESTDEDNFDIEVIETTEFLEPVEMSKLEESCILVEGDELHFVSQGVKKHSSYKKKICDALSLKLRSRRKQSLFVSDNDDAAGTMDCDKASSSAHNSCDFGWELL